MSDDAKAAKELVETLKDGERGFAEASEKLRDGDVTLRKPRKRKPPSARKAGAENQ